jgi:hypothetical protein
MTPTVEKGMTDIAVATARLISERRIDDEQVPIRVPSLGPEAAEIARDAMVVHGLALDAVLWYVKGALDTAGQDNSVLPEEWKETVNQVVSRVVEEYIAKRFAGLTLPSGTELIGSYIPSAEFEAMRRKMSNDNGARQVT